MTDALFRAKVLRDLSYVVSSPLILESFDAAELQRLMRVSVSRFLRLYPERIFRMVSRPEPRLPLGKWFERIFLAALRITFPFADIHHSVSDGAGGELDFLVVDTRQTTHIECAVKFFLRDPSHGSGLASYVGPGGQDRLDLKYHKMRDTQLKRQIPSRFVPGGYVKRVLWMSGRVHEPLGVLDSTSPAADISPLSARVAVGYWGSAADVLAIKLPHEDLYILPRQWWITDLTDFSRDDLAIFERLSTASQLAEPVMTARIRFEGERAVEMTRGFIVSR